MPGPVSVTDTCTSPSTRAGATDDAAARRRELDRVREQVEDHLAHAPLVAVGRGRRPGASSSESWTPFLVARSRTITTPRSSASRSEKAATSSSTCPASTFDRSSTSLIRDEQVVARGEDVVEVLLLLLVDLAEQPLLQHLREADDRVQRRPQLVRHVREELGLVPARRLELAVQPPQLVVHPVHVGGERAELVAVRHVERGRRSRRPRSPPAAPRCAGSARPATTRGSGRGRARAATLPPPTPMKRFARRRVRAAVRARSALRSRCSCGLRGSCARASRSLSALIAAARHGRARVAR